MCFQNVYLSVQYLLSVAGSEQNPVSHSPPPFLSPSAGCSSVLPLDRVYWYVMETSGSSPPWPLALSHSCFSVSALNCNSSSSVEYFTKVLFEHEWHYFLNVSRWSYLENHLGVHFHHGQLKICGLSLSARFVTPDVFLVQVSNGGGPCCPQNGIEYWAQDSWSRFSFLLVLQLGEVRRPALTHRGPE